MSLEHTVDLKIEVQTDPTGLGYGQWSSVSDDARILGIMADQSKRPITNIVIASDAIIALLDPTEFSALSDIKLQQLQLLLNSGSVNLGQSNIRLMLVNILPAAGASVGAIGAYYLAQRRTMSRLDELGWSITVGDMTAARVSS